PVRQSGRLTRRARIRLIGPATRVAREVALAALHVRPVIVVAVRARTLAVDGDRDAVVPEHGGRAGEARGTGLTITRGAGIVALGAIILSRTGRIAVLARARVRGRRFVVPVVGGIGGARGALGGTGTGAGEAGLVARLAGWVGGVVIVVETGHADAL